MSPTESTQRVATAPEENGATTATGNIGSVQENMVKFGCEVSETCDPHLDTPLYLSTEQRSKIHVNGDTISEMRSSCCRTSVV